jgi:hypothetical protein
MSRYGGEGQPDKRRRVTSIGGEHGATVQQWLDTVTVAGNAAASGRPVSRGLCPLAGQCTPVGRQKASLAAGQWSSLQVWNRMTGR